MDKHYQNRRKAGLLGAICVSLLTGWPAIAVPKPSSLIPQGAADKLLSQANPHPSIFNEPPYNRSTSQSEPSIAPTMQSTPGPGTAPSPAPPGSVIQPPLPSQLQAPSAIITPNNGIVNVTLMNQTGAIINYQVIGDTNQRSLPGKSNVVLQNLKTPITITFRRQDGGLLRVTPQATSEAGMLSVTFTETTDLGTDRNSMRIQRNGSVFLN
jgi:hypothetical protein